MQNKDACPYLEVVDPEYPQRAKDIIGELAAEVEEMRDNVRTTRNEFHFMQEVDRAVDREVRASLKKWKRWLIWAVALNVIQLLFHM